MTKAQLAELVAERNSHLKLIQQSTGPLSSLDVEQRRAVDKASLLFRSADFLIVQELRRRNQPVEITIGKRKSLLWLLQVADQFVELDPATGRPFGWPKSSFSAHSKLLYQYPEARRAS